MEVHFVYQNSETAALIVLGVFVESGGAENEEFGKYLASFLQEKIK